MVIIKKKKQCWWGWCREKETLMHIGGSVNWWNYYESSMVFPQKLKNRINVWPSNFTSGHLSEEENTNFNICTPVFFEALFVIAKMWKQVPNRRQMDKWNCIIFIFILFVSLNIIPSRSISAALKGKISFFYLAD